MTGTDETQPRATVLAVDDDPNVLSTLARALARENYRLLTVSEPTTVPQLVGENDVSVLVSDLDMPVMNGLELMSIIRRDHPQVVRILLTGGATLESALYAINQGEVFRYLTKPWDPEDLRQVIREALERARQLRTANNGGAPSQQLQQMLAALEQAHPGITARGASGEAHQISAESVMSAVDALESQAFSVLWRTL